MYFETGNDGNAGEITIDKAAMSTEGRTWRIKVTMLECGNRARAPDGCTQYFTGVSGTVQSYNFADEVMLQDLDYANCIRRERGYCQFRVSETQGVPDAFQLSAPQTSEVIFRPFYVNL